MQLYPDNTLLKLDFPFILKELSSLCSGDLGRNKVENSSFYTDIDELSIQLSYVKEMKSILELDTSFPMHGLDELHFLNKLKIEHYYLEIQELVNLFRFHHTCVEVFRFFSPKARQVLYPFLTQKIQAFVIEPKLNAIISAVIDVENVKIKENATPELSKIRKEIQARIQAINVVFKRVLNQYKRENLLAETEETIRDGRRVLSVKAEYKRVVKGMITDESETGNITYMEPTETVLLNNELTDLYLSERREIIRILKSLSSQIRPYAAIIEQLQELMSELDFIRAKSYFAINYKCSMPILSVERKIILHDFVHPLLFHFHSKHKKSIVANSMRLDEQCRILLISGPNAGGKSIVLKAIGLIQLMFQFGMLIPAKENSELSVFDQLFVDIGDQQSIENDLSTYSSHLSNMNYFLRYSNAKTLILIDEMGMGTDPALGGPMAEAILENLHQKNVFGIITTHFNNLKIYAAETANMQSGAMAFDTQQLKPLYQLHIGQPGSSFTFEIAQKSGLPNVVLNAASKKIGTDKKVLESTLTAIQNEKHFIKGLRKNVQAKEAQLSDLTKSYEQLNKELEKEKKRLLKQYEARLLEKFNAESKNLENAMRQWKEQKNNKEKFLQVRKFIDENRTEIEYKLDTEIPISNNKTELQKWKIGDSVKLTDGSEIGKIIALKNDKAIVQFGQLQTKVSVHKLVQVNNNSAQSAAKQKSYSSKKIIEKSAFDNTLDIRGLMKDEAINALDNYMDKVLMYGIRQIKIIHGKGTGALKQMVHTYLKNFPHIKSFQFESEQFGGDGITLVDLK
ncbi:MAG: Smr/MutS family protein [Chitinophagales bacterium]